MVEAPAHPHRASSSLPAIVWINWKHAETLTARDAAEIRSSGLVVGFSSDVLAETLVPQVFELWQELPTAGAAVERMERYRVSARVTGIPGGSSWTPSCGGSPEPVPPPGADVSLGPVIAARLVPLDGSERPAALAEGRYRVLVFGDHILGASAVSLPDGSRRNPAVDADHLAPGLPARCPTGDGVEGGTFQSWFSLQIA